MNRGEFDHEHLELPLGIHPEREEVRESPRFRRWWVGTWLAPLAFSAGILLWFFVVYTLIGNRPRDWQYGVFPYVPGASVFSTNPIPKGSVPNQVVLPENTSDVEDANP